MDNKTAIIDRKVWNIIEDASEQAWYYRSIVTLTERLSSTSAWLEYKTLTELVFGKEN